MPLTQGVKNYKAKAGREKPHQIKVALASGLMGGSGVGVPASGTPQSPLTLSVHAAASKQALARLSNQTVPRLP